MTATRNPLTTRTGASTVETDVDTDGDGQATITVGQLRSIESPEDVICTSPDGYVVQPVSVSDNTVTVEVYQSAGSAAELAAVTGGSDVTDVRIMASG